MWDEKHRAYKRRTQYERSYSSTDYVILRRRRAANLCALQEQVSRTKWQLTPNQESLDLERMRSSIRTKRLHRDFRTTGRPKIMIKRPSQKCQLWQRSRRQKEAQFYCRKMACGSDPSRKRWLSLGPHRDHAEQVKHPRVERKTLWSSSKIVNIDKTPNSGPQFKRTKNAS